MEYITTVVNNIFTLLMKSLKHIGKSHKLTLYFCYFKIIG